MEQRNPEGLWKEGCVRLRGPLTVLANSGQIERLRASDAAHLLGEARLSALEPDEKITMQHISNTSIVVFEVDPSFPSSMRRIEEVRLLGPDLLQIVALESADLSLVRTLLREGVADVVALPLAPEELLQAAISAFEKADQTSGPSVRLAPFVTVTRSLGGTGATTLVTHLAASFSDMGSDTCLLDLDLQFGRTAEVLGLQPRRSIKDLLEAGVRIDASLLQSVVAQHQTGLSLIAAPIDIQPLESINFDQLKKIIECIRQNYSFVFADMPSNLTNWSLSTLAASDLIIMMVEQNISSLRQAKRRLELFQSVGIDCSSVLIVVNRTERRLFGSISLSDVEEALGHKVIQGMHADDQNVGIAQDQGVLVGEIRAKSSYAADTAKLAKALKGIIEQKGSA